MKNRLKELRLERGWSQEDAAEVAGLKQPTYQRYESGRRKLHPEVMRILASAFRVQAYELIFDPSDDEDLDFLKKFKTLEDSDRAMVEDLILRLADKVSQQSGEL